MSSSFFSERLITEMADRMAEDGFRDAGYEYVSIDVSIFCHCALQPQSSCTINIILLPQKKFWCLGVGQPDNC